MPLNTMQIKAKPGQISTVQGRIMQEFPKLEKGMYGFTHLQRVFLFVFSFSFLPNQLGQIELEIQ
jgi:hypothetical protein